MNQEFGQGGVGMFKPLSTMSGDSAGKVGMTGGDLNRWALTASGGLFHTDVRAELGWV